MLRVLRGIAAVILLQTLYFKFTAHPDSVYIFSTLGMEPYGRIGIGIGELIASILLFVPRVQWMGAALAMGLMAGAIFFHLTKLGISVHDDHGKLFFMGVAVFVCCAILLWADRKKLPIVGKMF